jgi:hypothetical protein
MFHLEGRVWVEWRLSGRVELGVRNAQQIFGITGGSRFTLGFQSNLKWRHLLAVLFRRQHQMPKKINIHFAVLSSQTTYR